jgi:hypothetical protein
MKFNIWHDNNGFYIDSDNGAADTQISRLCGLDVKEYQDILLTNFKAIIVKVNQSKFECYFTKEQDAEEIIEWLESMVIMNKLSG